MKRKRKKNENPKLHYVGEDDWGRQLFKILGTDTTLVDVDGELHTRTPDWGEPCAPTGTPTPDAVMKFDDMELIYSPDDNGWYFQRYSDWKVTKVFSTQGLAAKALREDDLVWDD